MIPISTSPRVLGCDVGKDEIVVFDAASARVRRIPNRPEELAAFAAELGPDCLVVCEATGGHELALLAAMLAAGVPAHRADARKVRAFIRSFGVLGKADTIDARALARYGGERRALLPLWRARDEERARLHGLVLARRDIVRDRVAYQNRRNAPGAEASRGVFDGLIEALERAIAAIEADIRALTESCEPIGEAVEALVAIPGFGLKTAVALVALLPELGTLANKQIASLAGLAPHPNQSGAADRYRQTRGGRPEVKRTLFMAAMAARRHNPALAVFFDRLVARGKKPIVALVAVMRKLVVIANAVLRPPRAARAA
jgi:transposase